MPASTLRFLQETLTNAASPSRTTTPPSVNAAAIRLTKHDHGTRGDEHDCDQRVPRLDRHSDFASALKGIVSVGLTAVAFACDV